MALGLAWVPTAATGTADGLAPLRRAWLAVRGHQNCAAAPALVCRRNPDDDGSDANGAPEGARVACQHSLCILIVVDRPGNDIRTCATY
ncbi:hypothetical protein AURDEDRAFT_176832 [Auricularia subglabra TFB-10046 SS5]|uniref:Uncharacterized protein n=1 Tax=Auricularia subglabra (strain TFB-10046 / SS5) TaxID=717982 RepID=J0L8C4_AURST|nr:hypothetical protein AURDEDRAFT_178336 [Auricularia subglabra TFB-10046 SS5]EJD34115.1 hypothetical protein AURDEDRAFT_176832 [Auricularia subglabra TFB-10046 SS5]